VASSWSLREEREIWRVPDGGNDKRPIEVSVEPLAAAFRNEEAAVASRALEKALGVVVLRRMGRAHGIVRAQPAQVERPLKMGA
jgi:hypothetical protein